MEPMTPAHEDATIRQLSTRMVYANPWMSVREDRVERLDGSRGIYSVVERADFAVVVPAESGGYHLVEQYRYPIAERCWEFPQGSYPDRVNGDPVELARAELAEETGFRAGAMTHLGRLLAAPGVSVEGFDVFLATGLVAGAPDREVTEQGMRQRWFSRADLEDMIRSGQVNDSATIAAYSLLLLSGVAA